MQKLRFSSVFWDFGGVITSSPFEAFSNFELNNNLPKDFIRKVNSTNHKSNAWAQLEQSKINLEEFDVLFKKESKSPVSENNLNTDKFRDELEKQSVRRLKRAPQRIRYYKKSD